MNGPASAFIFDTKGENAKVTARARAAFGPVYFIDGTDPDTATVNFLDLVLDCFDGSAPIEKAYTRADLITKVALPEGKGGDNPFWIQNARGLMSLSIVLLCKYQPERAVMPELWDLLTDPQRLREMLERGADELASDSLSETVRTSCRKFLNFEKDEP